MIRMMNVESSMFTELGYDKTNQSLLVRYTNGVLYQYFEVPEYLWNDMQAADSMGSFFSKNIREEYRFEKLEE